MSDNEAPKGPGGRPRKADPPRIDYQLLDKLLVFGDVVPTDDGAGTTVVYPTYRDLAARFGVVPSVISDYAKSRNCQRRRAEAQARIEAKTDAKLVELRAESVAVAKADALGIIDRYLVEFGKAVQEGRVRADSVTDFNTMMRLKEFLSGGADSRQELMGGVTLEALQLRHREMIRVADDATEAECGVVEGGRMKALPAATGGGEGGGVAPARPIEDRADVTERGAHGGLVEQLGGEGADADFDATAATCTDGDAAGDFEEAGPSSSSDAGASSSRSTLERNEVP
jgi:hypothetical protein